MCNVNSALIDFFFPRKDEVDDQKSELSTLKSKVEDLKEDANKKNEMIGVSVILNDDLFGNTSAWTFIIYEYMYFKFIWNWKVL